MHAMPLDFRAEPLSPLETDLIALLRNHGIEERLIDDHLVRIRAVVAVQEVSKQMGRPLKRDERRRAHVQHMDGRTVEEIVAKLRK